MTQGLMFTYSRGHITVRLKIMLQCIIIIFVKKVLSDGGGILSESLNNDKNNTIEQLKEILGANRESCIVTCFDEEKYKDSAVS